MFSLLLALVASVGAMAEDVSGLTVEYVATGSEEYIQAVKSIGRISFSGGTVVVRFTDGARLELGALADIEQIAFGKVDEAKVAEIPEVAVEPDPTVPPKGEGDDEEISTPTPINQTPVQKLVVSVSPNPTADHISISGVENGEVVRIFNAEGRIVLSGAQTEFDLGNLPKGVYLLQAGSEIVKIIKK